MDVGVLVVAHAQPSKLVEPGKSALHNPAPTAQAFRALYDAWPTAERYGERAIRIGSPPRRSRDPRRRNVADTAVVRAPLVAAEWHPPTAVPPVSRCGWLPSA